MKLLLFFFFILLVGAPDAVPLREFKRLARSAYFIQAIRSSPIFQFKNELLNENENHVDLSYEIGEADQVWLLCHCVWNECKLP
jgi:hypothetical protein